METFDQFFDTRPKPSLWKASLEYGLYAGLCIVAISLINLIPGVPNSPWFLSVVSWTVYTAVVIAILRHFKEKKNGRNLTYGQGVGLSALTGLNGGFIAAVVIFAVYTMKPELTDTAMQLALENLSTQNMTDEQLSISVKTLEIMINPPMIAIMTLFGSVLNFTIVALIASAFLKND
jgi:hypothetical protein